MCGMEYIQESTNGVMAMGKKLTYAEIVKAFELCFAEIGTAYTCTVCPYHKFGELCKVKRDRDTFDLINRLQEKNSNLQEKNLNLTSDLTSLQNDLTSLKAENERLKKGWKADIQLTAEAKTEAYKEFAESLEEMMSYEHFFETDVVVLDKSKLDNLLKELVGEDK